MAKDLTDQWGTYPFQQFVAVGKNYNVNRDGQYEVIIFSGSNDVSIEFYGKFFCEDYTNGGSSLWIEQIDRIVVHTKHRDTVLNRIKVFWKNLWRRFV